MNERDDEESRSDADVPSIDDDAENSDDRNGLHDPDQVQMK